MNDSSEEGEKTIQPVGNIGYKKVLITGQGSYIGTAVERWLLKDKDHYQVDTLDMQDETSLPLICAQPVSPGFTSFA